MKHLAIGPGAMAYFAFLGAMGALRDCHELDNLEAISGASAGGLLAFFYVVAEGNIKTIIDYSLGIPIKDIMKPNIRQFLKHFGLVSQKKIRTVIIDIIRVFFSKEDLTFRELQALRPTMPKIHISAYCVNLGRTEYFSCDTITQHVCCGCTLYDYCRAISICNSRQPRTKIYRRWYHGGYTVWSFCGVHGHQSHADCVVRNTRV